ncbi:MAG TPA: hypothetical protein VJH34_04375 [archaeon]|nr:hypothetical protein [archaeon]
MKKEKILLILCIMSILLLIVSCSGKQTQAQVQQPQEEAKVVAPPIDEVIPAPELSAEVKELLTNKDKITSYSYKFGELNQRNTYHILRDKVKIELFEKPGKKAEEQYDTVYLDNTKKTAFGTCEKTGCSQSEKNKYRAISFEQYQLKSTPLTILEDVQSAEITKQGKLVNNRDTILVKMNNSKGDQIDAFLDKFYAFPHEAKITGADKKETLLQYFEVTINSLKESDMVLPKSYQLINTTS